MIQHTQYSYWSLTYASLMIWWFDVVNSLWISYLCHGVLTTYLSCHTRMHLAYRCIVIGQISLISSPTLSGFPPDWCEELYWWQCQQLLLGATTSGSNFHYHRFRRLDQGAQKLRWFHEIHETKKGPNPKKKEGGKLKLHECFEMIFWFVYT